MVACVLIASAISVILLEELRSINELALLEKLSVIFIPVNTFPVNTPALSK